MATNAPTAPALAPAELPGTLSKRVLRSFRAQVEDWHDACRNLSAWEDGNLIDNPSPEKLGEHAKLLDELECVGHWISLVTQSGDFPDRASADLVSLTLQDLKDARALWHGNMSKERSQEILGSILHES